MDCCVHYLPFREKRLFHVKQEFATLEAFVRNRICGVCTQRNADGDCGLEQPSACALFRLFPRVAEAIHSVDGNDIHEHIEAIRRNVCSVCPDQAGDGTCEQRRQVRCALDAYLIPVVDAIEEASVQALDRRVIGLRGANPPGPELRFLNSTGGN